MALDVLGDALPGLEVDDAHRAVPVGSGGVLRLASQKAADVLEAVDAPGDRDRDGVAALRRYPQTGPLADRGAEDTQGDVDVGAHRLLDVGANAQRVAVSQVGVEALDHGAGAVCGQASLPGGGVAEVDEALLEGLPQCGTAQVLALCPFGDGVDEAAQGLRVAGGSRSAAAGQEPLEGAGGQALHVGGADPYPLAGGDEGGAGGGAGRADPGGGVGAGYALAGEVGQQVDGGTAAAALGVGGCRKVPADGGVAQLPHQAAQGEVAGVGGQERGAVGVGQGDPRAAGDLGQEG